MNSISLVKLFWMPQKIQIYSNSIRDTCTASKYFPNEKCYTELLKTINSYLEERCSGLFRSLRSVKKGDSYMSKYSSEALEKNFLNTSCHTIDFTKDCSKVAVSSPVWGSSSELKGFVWQKRYKGFKKIDQHWKFLRFVTIIYLESVSLHTLFHFQRSLLF